MAEPQGTEGWIGASLFFGWWTYLFVSVMELAAWIVYETGDLGFAQFYFSVVGYWGSILTYPLPWLFAAVHIGVYGVDNFPGSWAIFLLVIQTVLWIVHSLLHIYFVDDFLLYIDAQTPTVCECSIPLVPALPENPTAQYVSVRQAAIAEREELCKLECPSGEGSKAPVQTAAAAAPEEETADTEEKADGWI